MNSSTGEHPSDSVSDLGTTFLFDVVALAALVLFYYATQPCRSSIRSEEAAEQLLRDQERDLNRVSELPLLKKASSSTDSPTSTVALCEFLGFPEATNIFGWIKVLATISDQKVLVHCRKDGFLYLLFIKYLCVYFLLLSAGGCGVLLPMFLMGKSIDRDLLTAYTIRNILSSRWKLWVVLLFTALYTAMAFVMLYLFHHRLRSIAATEVTFAVCRDQK
ncbi:MAG: hypothetical protein P4M11_14225 [Candidatus Pacebacteria bacterium]|nr:hypothetical protein [Candidatus Paceibacterota bacterium]